jgi:hypothetical protein
MKKALVILLALALVFGLVLTACDIGGGGGGGGKKPSPTPEVPGGELEDKVVLELSTNEAIQALPEGKLTFGAGDDGNPIKPLVRAGEDSHADYIIIKVDGKNAIKFDTKDSWGIGIDLPDSEFGFREDDVVTVTGKVNTLAGGGRIQFNKAIGGENAIGNKAEAEGPFTITATLTAADVTAIRGNNNKALRIEARGTGNEVEIYDIKIEGKRPSTIAKLAAPVIALEDATISWPAVEGAGGYTVFADEEEVTTLTSGTSYNLALSTLVPGTYSITVVALGVAGSSLDSDPSNAVSYTKPVPDAPFEVTFTADMLSTDPAQGTAVVYDGGAGYTWTAAATGGWGNGYACFKVDLGEPLANFVKLTFVYNKIGGDTTYKAVKLFASTSPITGYDGGSDKYILAAPEGNTVTNGEDQAIELVIDADVAATVTETELYFAIDVPMGISDGASSYTIYDVVFVK